MYRFFGIDQETGERSVLATITAERPAYKGHLQGFRGSAEFCAFFGHIQPFVSEIEEMRHYESAGFRTGDPIVSDVPMIWRPKCE